MHNPVIVGLVEVTVMLLATVVVVLHAEAQSRGVVGLPTAFQSPFIKSQIVFCIKLSSYVAAAAAASVCLLGNRVKKP